MYASSRTAPAAPAVRERTCGVWSMKGAVVSGETPGAAVNALHAMPSKKPTFTALPSAR